MSSAARSSEDSLVWQESKLSPGSPSPVVLDDHVFVINSAGVLTCGSLEAKEIAWRQRLGGSFWATPVVSGNHLYCINSVGKSFVVRLEGQERIVSENEFGEDILASPAVADDALFVRSHQHSMENISLGTYPGNTCESLSRPRSRSAKIIDPSAAKEPPPQSFFGER